MPPVTVDELKTVVALKDQPDEVLAMDPGKFSIS